MRLFLTPVSHVSRGLLSVNAGVWIYAHLLFPCVNEYMHHYAYMLYALSIVPFTE